MMAYVMTHDINTYQVPGSELFGVQLSDVFCLPCVRLCVILSALYCGYFRCPASPSSLAGEPVLASNAASRSPRGDAEGLREGACPSSLRLARRWF